MTDALFEYRAFTLLDITPTAVTTFSQEKESERNQHRNWETVTQLLSLRTQPAEVQFINALEANLEAYDFGINYTGIHKVWIFKFFVEYDDVFKLGNDRYGKLKQDFSLVPVITGLTETALPDLPLIYTSGPWKNMYFKLAK